MSQKLLREQFLRQREGTQIHFFIPKSVTFRVCTEPFAHLRRISIGELRRDVTATGFYLLLRTLDNPIQCSGVMLLVEDHHGDVAVCFLHDHVYTESSYEDFISPGTVFILKEPCQTTSTGNNSIIVVGSPSDFVKVDRSHVLFKEKEDLGWGDKTLEHEPRTAEEWRLVGNGYFKSAKYQDAVDAYSVALDLCEDKDTKLVLHLNLAASYLITGYYERTLEHTSKVLEVQPLNEKALFRTARAYYELRNFVEAERIMKELVLTHPTNKNAVFELNRCKERLKECRIGVQVLDLYLASLANPDVPIDFACYIGDVRVETVIGRGRGVIANSDIRCGTLILAEKALVANLSEKSSYGIGAGVLTKLLVEALSKNPSTVAEIVYNMTSNNEDWDNLKHVLCDDGRPVIQYERLLQIVNMNSFSLTSECNGVTSMSTKRALFPFASYFNHSCTCNSAFEIFNDVIAIRSLTDISEGEEITISYASNVATFPMKESLLRSYRFSCTCVVCKMDREEPPEVHDERDKLTAEVKSLYLRLAFASRDDDMSKTAQSKLSEVVTKLEKSYSKRKNYCVHLFRSYLLLAQSIETHGPEFRCEFLKVIDSGLQAVGLSIKSLFKAANNSLPSLPKDSLICKLLFQYASVCARAELSYSRPDQVNRWVRVLLMLERLYTGGDMRLLRERFKDSLLMSLVIENAGV